MATPQTLDPPKTIPKQIEDLTLLDEVSARTAGVSRLEMCIQCGTCGGSCPLAAMSPSACPASWAEASGASMFDAVNLPEPGSMLGLTISESARPSSVGP